MKKQLPSRPNLEQLKKQAKSLLRGQRAAVPAILARASVNTIREGRTLQRLSRVWRHRLGNCVGIRACEPGDRRLSIDPWSKAQYLLCSGDRRYNR
jgi:hypothetical protein